MSGTLQNRDGVELEYAQGHEVGIKSVKRTMEDIWRWRMSREECWQKFVGGVETEHENCDGREDRRWKRRKKRMV